jgi:hypothetical protein
MTLVLTSKKEKAPPEMEVLFSIDGVAYEIPLKFGANVALQFARIVLQRGRDEAVAWALEKALGATGFGALMAFDDLEPEQLHKITIVILERMASAMELPKGGLRAV